MKHAPEFLALVDEAKTRIRECTVEDVEGSRARNEPFTLIDVREDSEFARDHAAGARHVGRGILERDIVGLVPDKDARIVLYCGGGYRSALAADSLQKMGYTNVLSLAGGMHAIREAGFPLEK